MGKNSDFMVGYGPKTQHLGTVLQQLHILSYYGVATTHTSCAPVLCLSAYKPHYLYIISTICICISTKTHCSHLFICSPSYFMFLFSQFSYLLGAPLCSHWGRGQSCDWALHRSHQYAYLGRCWEAAVGDFLSLRVETW